MVKCRPSGLICEKTTLLTKGGKGGGHVWFGWEVRKTKGRTRSNQRTSGGVKKKKIRRTKKRPSWLKGEEKPPPACLKLFQGNQKLKKGKSSIEN